ncbi:hypothetical protein CEV33_2021 [Brucella grignonensis]|uniref:Uncharacterized protein n=1 Tax=Brucella grignonensis TaxID=94627 RepID=A0A256F6S4_9HYPH|nr:hypothetical protein CEV33_2021 [Brucella grignonensis]
MILSVPAIAVARLNFSAERNVHKGSRPVQALGQFALCSAEMVLPYRHHSLVHPEKCEAVFG